MIIFSMKEYFIEPLELGKKNLKLWESSGYKCIAIVDDNKMFIQNSILKYSSKLLSDFGKAFVIIWFFDDESSQSIHSESLASLTTIRESDACLIYAIGSISDIQLISKFWGEYDSLDIIFPKNYDILMNAFINDFYKNYNRYIKDFFNIVSHANAIISDSGDGEEVQIIISDELYGNLRK